MPIKKQPMPRLADVIMRAVQAGGIVSFGLHRCENCADEDPDLLIMMDIGDREASIRISMDQLEHVPLREMLMSVAIGTAMDHVIEHAAEQLRDGE